MPDLKEIFKITWLPVFAASLCCFAPVVLVLFGLSTVAFAASLADLFYGEYKWYFRLMGLLLLSVSFVMYLRQSKGICTLDQAKRRRNEILNWAAVILTAAVIGYLIWLYVIVEIIGYLLGIWSLYGTDI